MDYLVTGVRQTAEARLVVAVSAPGLAVEPVDPTDCLSPAAWLLAGTGAPLVRQVEPLPSGADPVGGASSFALDLDAPLRTGVAYLVGLAAQARSYGGLGTSTAALAFQGALVLGVASQSVGKQGADVAFPVLVAGGDLVLVDRLTGLQNRIATLVAARLGAFAHLPDFGLELEPKRTYSAARLAQAVATLKTSLLADPDVAGASVTTSGTGHAQALAIVVKPVFAADHIQINAPIQAGMPR